MNSIQQTLADTHLGLVHFVIHRYVPKKRSFRTDELLSFGTFGLVDAAKAFDPTLGTKFSTFAVPRIRGSILDGMRNADYYTRRDRIKISRLRLAQQRLHGKLHREPSDAELAAQLDMSASEVRELHLLACHNDSCEVDKFGSILPASTPMPGEHVTRASTAAFLRKMLCSLKPRERQMLTMHYFDDLTMTEIADLTGVTLSRVCQIHKKALAKLREHPTLQAELQ